MRSDSGANGTGILILPDVRGLFHFYERLACAVGAEGYYALAIEYFGRTTGLDPRGEDWDSWEEDMDATSPAQVTLDLQAGLARLGEMGADRNFLLGFCFGGGMIFRNVDRDLGVAGMMAVYGVAHEWRQYPEAYGNLARSAHPVVALFGGADQGVPPEEVAAVAAALNQSPAPHDVHVYPGAPHSFSTSTSANTPTHAATSGSACSRSPLPRSTPTKPGPRAHRHVRSPDRAMCVRFESRPRATAGRP